MPVEYVIHRELRLVVTTGRGRVTAEELVEHRERLLKDSDFDPTFNQFSDFSELERTNLQPNDVRAFAREQVFAPVSRRALLVRRPHQFGVTRQYQAYHEDRSNVQVFYDRQEALDWLGIPADAIK